jgi:uncharacterized caspase-like protein
VGVSKFQNELLQLQYGESDARRVAHSLETKGVAVTTLISPTRTQMAEAVTKILRTLGTEDSFYFYFSGHGWTESGASYLGAADMDVQEGRPSRGYELDSLKGAIRAAHLKSAFAFLDICQTELTQSH